jgi:hypothetical protein
MPHPTRLVAVRDGFGGFATLDPAIDYPEDHELVEAYPQFFAAVEVKGQIVENGVVVSVEVPPAPQKDVAAKRAPGRRKGKR